MSDLRDPGDAWVTAADGNRYWGRFGAAGLLAYDRGLDAILMQHRVSWSDHGNTWGIPGGALNQGEAAIAGAIRESQEEAGVPDDAVIPRYTHVLDRGGWTYTTVIAEVQAPFTPEITDPESHALEWVPVDAVTEKPLHPAFATSWELLRSIVRRRPTIIVDAANVVGTVPDGWWKDRKGSTERLRDRIEAHALSGIGVRPAFMRMPAELHGGLVFPDWVFITESTARGISPTGNVRVVDAEHSGDDAIVAEAQALAASGGLCVVVTSDAELRVRCAAVGVDAARGSKKLLELLERGEQ
ncbi:NUDIX domain-containing protein [Leucobacter albus]|uniref:NUDIX domain-containing protein n=1 Tax=Leucobacter albus TaxID=272210 RepID=A0ABW3TP08_9MICO